MRKYAARRNHFSPYLIHFPKGEEEIRRAFSLLWGERQGEGKGLE